MAIALIAEYGEFWPSAISLTGSKRVKSSPQRSSQAANRVRSGISPIPQLARDGIENSGTSAPAWRAPTKFPSGMRQLHHPPNAFGEDRRGRQQADDQKRLVWEVDEKSWMYDDAGTFEELDCDFFFAAGRWDTQHRGPSGIDRQNLYRSIVPRDVAQLALVRTNAVEDLSAYRRSRRKKRWNRVLDGSGYRQVCVANQLQPVECLPHDRFGPVHNDPSKLHLRKASGLREAAQPKGQAIAARRQ